MKCSDSSYRHQLQQGSSKFEVQSRLSCLSTVWNSLFQWRECKWGQGEPIVLSQCWAIPSHLGGWMLVTHTHQLTNSAPTRLKPTLKRCTLSHQCTHNAYHQWPHSEVVRSIHSIFIQICPSSPTTCSRIKWFIPSGVIPLWANVLWPWINTKPEPYCCIIR